jgi:HK97 family phage portal protein
MQMVAVYSCIDILSRTVGSLPLYLYRRLPDGGKELVRKHPLFSLMRRQPNPEMTAMRYRSTLQGHLASWGNCYSYIDWAGEWIPEGGVADPSRPRRRSTGKQASLRTATIRDRMIRKSSRASLSPRKNMLHIPGFGFDGVIGYSPIFSSAGGCRAGDGRRRIRGAILRDRNSPSMVIEHPNQLKDRKAFREATEDVYGGLGKSHRIMILEEGMRRQKIAIDPKDSQFLETRKFQISEICRLFHVPPHIVGRC